MRKTAAYSDLDFSLDETDKKKPRRSLARRLLGHRPVARLGAGALALLGAAVIVNVMYLQDQRHAAPLFQANLRKQATAALDQVVDPPAPTPRPAELASAPAARPILARVEPPAREIAHADAPQKSDKSKTSEIKRADPIGGLMRSVGAIDTQQNEPARDVLAAQRALMKLGFVIKPDGLFGGTTRQAIERFERDNHWPVRGVLTTRIKSELARLSGVEAD